MTAAVQTSSCKLFEPGVHCAQHPHSWSHIGTRRADTARDSL